MTEIIIARHAEAKSNTEPHLVAGRSNEVPLTERGVKQAYMLGNYLKTAGIMPDVVYVSPATRTRHTIELALGAAEYSRSPIIDSELQEMSQGVAEGQLRKNVYTDEVTARINSELFEFKLLDGESVSEVGLRMQRRMQIYAERHPNGIILIGGHGMAINCLTGLALDWSHERITRSQNTPENTSLTFLSVDHRGIDPDSISYTSPSVWGDVVH